MRRQLFRRFPKRETEPLARMGTQVQKCGVNFGTARLTIHLRVRRNRLARLTELVDGDARRHDLEQASKPAPPHVFQYLRRAFVRHKQLGPCFLNDIVQEGGSEFHGREPHSHRREVGLLKRQQGVTVVVATRERERNFCGAVVAKLFGGHSLTKGSGKAFHKISCSKGLHVGPGQLRGFVSAHQLGEKKLEIAIRVLPRLGTHLRALSPLEECVSCRMH